MSVTVWEYYDGYQHLWEEEDESERVKVQYFVLGDIDDDRIGICYTSFINFVAIISLSVHGMAWKKTEITIERAREYLRKTYTKNGPTLEDYKRKYDELLTTKTAE